MTLMDNLVTRERAAVHDLNVVSDDAQDRAEFSLRRSTLVYHKEAADAAAGTATTERALLVVPAHVTNGIEIVSVTLCAAATSTADNANNAIISVYKRAAGGGSQTKLAERSTDADTADAFGNLGTTITANIPTAFSRTSVLATRSLAAGESLTLEITKPGTGVVVGAGSIVVVYDEL